MRVAEHHVWGPNGPPGPHRARDLGNAHLNVLGVKRATVPVACPITYGQPRSLAAEQTALTSHRSRAGHADQGAGRFPADGAQSPYGSEEETWKIVASGSAASDSGKMAITFPTSANDS